MTVTNRHTRATHLKNKTNMNNQNSNSNMISMKVTYLKIHPVLKELGIEALSQFELEVNKKFNVSNELVIANDKGEVISNWEYILACKDTTINVAQVNVSDDELILLLATKNLRKRLKPGKQILLGVKLRDSLKRTGYAKELLSKVEGKSFTEKIGKLVGSSYGTFQKYFLIEKYAPGVKDSMDNGECSLAEAVKIAKTNRDQIRGKLKSPQDIISSKSNKKKKTEEKRVGLAIDGFAGSDKFKPCEMFKGITLRKFDGTEIDITPKANHLVESKQGFKDDTAEYYQIFNPESQAFIQVIIKNIEKL